MQNLTEQIHYQIFGSEEMPKCVFLHGIMGQGKNWRSIAKRFSRYFQCMIYDQRGHGQSFRPISGYDPITLADDLKDLLSELGWNGPINLVGHSMGGRVALVFANKYPDLVKKLVIVDIGASSGWQSMQAVLEKLDFVPVPFKSRDEAREFIFGPFLQKYPNKMVADFFYSNIIEINPGEWGWIFYKAGIKQALESSRIVDYWSHFHDLKMPTLLIRGETSTDLRQEEFDKILANNPRIHGEVVAKAGHWVHAEQPTETLKILGQFFEIAGSAT